jgi:hypothetical protein
LKITSFFLKIRIFTIPQQLPFAHKPLVQGRYQHGKKDGYFGKSGFFSGDFFEFPGDCRLEIPWQGHTPEDAWQNLFHCLSAFWGGNKLTDRLLALR